MNRAHHEDDLKVSFKRFLENCEWNNTQLSVKSTEFGVRRTVFIGFNVAFMQYSPREKLCSAISSISGETLGTGKKMKAFVALVNVFRAFVPEFSALTSGLLRHTRTTGKIFLSPEDLEAVEKLKHIFVSAPILVPFKNGLKTELVIDGGKPHIGILVEDCKDDQVLFQSGKLSKSGKFSHDWVCSESGLTKNAITQPTPGEWKPVEYVISGTTVFGRFPFSDTVPLAALKIMAEFKRDPGRFPY